MLKISKHWNALELTIIDMFYNEQCSTVDCHLYFKLYNISFFDIINVSLCGLSLTKAAFI